MYYMFSITVISKLIKALTGREIDEISENIGFNKRKSGLKAAAFFKAFTIGIWDAHDITLDIIAGKCEEFQYGLKLKKQSLLNRLKLGAELMKQALGMATNFALKNSLKNETIEVLKQFRDVLVYDSTIISLPDKLKNTYIGRMHNVGKDYLECIIFGKLIIITLMTALFSVFNAITFKRTGRLISFMRFFKNLREKLNEISMNLNYRGARNILEAINRVISRSMEEKRKRKTTQSKLMEHDLPLIVLQMLA